jgi:hypothetical protein
MDVEYRLPGVCSSVDDEPVAGLSDAFLIGQVAGNGKQVPNQGFIIQCNVINRSDMLLGHDQDMGGSGGIDIPESRSLLILVDNIARDFPSHDFTENTASVHISSFQL